MRITQAERFFKRVESFFAKTERCDKCQDEVLEEHMFRIDIPTYHWALRDIRFLCATCAPNKDAAMEHWSKEKEKS